MLDIVFLFYKMVRFNHFSETNLEQVLIDLVKPEYLIDINSTERSVELFHMK